MLYYKRNTIIILKIGGLIMKKKIIASLLLTLTLAGVSQVDAQAVWKTDSYNNKVWVEQGGTKPGWKYIDGYWYYLGMNGVPYTGWLEDGGNWYYMWSNGTMAYNSWMTNGGFWYYFDNSGKMVSDYVDVGVRGYDFTNPAMIISTTSGSVTIANEDTAKKQEQDNIIVSDDSKSQSDNVESEENK